jgi:hypothetical protein
VREIDETICRVDSGVYSQTMRLGYPLGSKATVTSRADEKRQILNYFVNRLLAILFKRISFDIFVSLRYDISLFCLSSSCYDFKSAGTL